jgi:OFA family oxalate/formate antiporter-like MFS transporter
VKKRKDPIGNELNKKPWFIVGVSFVVLGLVYSVWYSFALFFVAILKEFGWDRSTVAAGFSIFVLVHGLAGPFIGKIVDQLGISKTFLIGALFLAIGMSLCTIIRSPWQLYLFYGLVTSVGVACTGWIPNSTLIQQWFPKKRGLPIGIISAGVGIGIFLYVPCIQYLIFRIGWRLTYLLLGGCLALLLFLVAILGIKRPPTPIHTSPDVPFSSKACSSSACTLRQACGTRPFWYLAALFFFSNFVIQGVLAHHVAFFTDHGVKLETAAFIVGLIGIISIGTKILWGTLSDAIGREMTYTLGIACSIGGLIALILFANSHAFFLPFTYGVLFSMGYAASACLPPLVIADFSQEKRMAVSSARCGYRTD